MQPVPGQHFVLVLFIPWSCPTFLLWNNGNNVFQKKPHHECKLSKGWYLAGPRDVKPVARQKLRLDLCMFWNPDIRRASGFSREPAWKPSITVTTLLFCRTASSFLDSSIVSSAGNSDRIYGSLTGAESWKEAVRYEINPHWSVEWIVVNIVNE